MTQTQRKVTLMYHTQMAAKFKAELIEQLGATPRELYGATDGQMATLTAIRTCYSPNKPSEILALEGEKYFRNAATDGGPGTDADRLIRMITASKHTSTLEGPTFTFAIEGVSRALLAQLTRHRIGMSFSVQSQRYVKFGSDDKSGGMDYVVPDSVTSDKEYTNDEYFTESADEIFERAMDRAQFYYDKLRKAGVPAEDARAVLPNAAAVNLVMTGNLTSLLSFYHKRRKGNGAQSEIAGLAEDIKNAIIEVESWTAQLFEREA